MEYDPVKQRLMALHFVVVCFEKLSFHGQALSTQAHYKGKSLKIVFCKPKIYLQIKMGL